VFPALALGLGTGSRGLMSAHPRPATEPLLGRLEWLFIVIHGATITLSVLAAFWFAHNMLELTGNAAVTVSFLTLALTQLWHVFNLRANGSGLLDNQVTRNRFVWLALAICGLILFAAFAVPALASVLHLAGIGWRGWLLVATASVLPTLLGQLMIHFRLPFTVREAVLTKSVLLSMGYNMGHKIVALARYGAGCPRDRRASLRVATAMLVPCLIIGCVQTSQSARQDTGTAVGAITGAILGHQIDHDHGALFGAAIGAIAGSSIGRYQDEQQRALESALAHERRVREIDIQRLQASVLSCT